MPIEVDIRTGQVTGGSLSSGCDFGWKNSSTQNVALTPSSNYCTGSSYDIGAGQVKPAVAANPLPAPPYNFTLSPNVWNAPSNPHIQTPSMAVDAVDREVA
ncbi:MAG TPA: hypothetical protein VGM18_01485 [Candidatus Sulfotelmatobacter sp.]|jgi:hypothetical protein